MECAHRSENQFADALATLGSQVPFEKESTLIRVCKQQSSKMETLKKMFPKEPDGEDLRNLIKEKVEKLEHGGSVKDLKDYTLIDRELYRRLPRGILSRCVSEKEAKQKLEELHS